MMRQVDDVKEVLLLLFILKLKDEEGENAFEKKWRDFDNLSSIFEMLFSSVSFNRLAASLISKFSYTIKKKIIIG